MKTIVAAVDFSDLTHAVIDAAQDLACAFDGEVVLFHAAPEADPWALAAMDGRAAVGMPSPTWEREQLHHCQQRLDTLEATMAERGVKVRTHLTDAVRRRSICDALEQLAPEFVVIGSHRHGALYDLLGPGICSRIVRRAKCPVVVVHPQDRSPSFRPIASRPAPKPAQPEISSNV